MLVVHYIIKYGILLLDNGITGVSFPQFYAVLSQQVTEPKEIGQQHKGKPVSSNLLAICIFKNLQKVPHELI